MQFGSVDVVGQLCFSRKVSYTTPFRGCEIVNRLVHGADHARTFGVIQIGSTSGVLARKKTSRAEIMNFRTSFLAPYLSVYTVVYYYDNTWHKICTESISYTTREIAKQLGETTVQH